MLEPDNSEVSEPKWMLQHSLDGHIYRDDCPWCVQSRLKARRATRKVRESYLNPAGVSVVSDFSGPHEMDVSGNRFSQMIVDLDSGWGHVGLQETRTANDTLDTIKDMQVMMRSESGGKAESLAQFHHDDDKSYRGNVEKYLLDKGVLNTHTGGYNPNSNAVAERRIGMLQQLFRTVLLYCTGGLLYYEQLWGYRDLRL